MIARGQELMQQCKDLVIEYLNHHSTGVTNQQVANETGLYLDVPNHKGYVSWTILEHLVAKGSVEKVDQKGKRGGVYRLKAQHAMPA